ncbi:hypothetical protein V1478_002318 [Vespula squamosa]|uniref:Uncharacterized protein n=1 Tax=Vespula squamosa TaxID=30214 RepID=A0ABD2BVZ3_VESSQ
MNAFSSNYFSYYNTNSSSNLYSENFSFRTSNSLVRFKGDIRTQRKPLAADFAETKEDFNNDKHQTKSCYPIAKNFLRISQTIFRNMRFSPENSRERSNDFKTNRTDGIFSNHQYFIVDQKPMQRIAISLTLYTCHQQNYAPGEVLKATDSFSWDVCDHIRHKNSTLGSTGMELMRVIDSGACTLHRLVPQGEEGRERVEDRTRLSSKICS